MQAMINNWPLSRKMLVAFAIIGALLVAVASAGIFTNNRLSAASDRLIARGMAGTMLMSGVLDQLREQRIIVYSRHTAVDAEEIAQLGQRLAKNQAALTAGVAEYGRVAGEGFETEVDALTSDVTGLNATATKIVETGDPVARLALIKGGGKTASRTAIAGAETLQKMTTDRSAALNVEGKAFAALALKVSAGLSLLALVGLFAIWRVIGRTVASPMAALANITTQLAKGEHVTVPSRDRADELGQIARAVQSFSEAAASRAEADATAVAEQSGVTVALGNSLRAMSAGDLTMGITADFTPAYQALKTDFNAALGSLAGMIGSVSEGVGAIRTGSVEISQASEDLARRTESNAASLEETSAALVQIEARIRTSAGASATTVARADQAIASVGSGRATAEGAMQAMSRVSSSAKGIDSVIEGVDKIAFQTRVLAMNAAVEAGRAGDAGRGFAVVADLVSALAQRAEEEAKRARDQLTVTQAEILIAVDAVQKVDGNFVAISGDVDAVHGLLAAMAEDNLAQAAAITQITSAVGSMDKATQQNAAMVEQTSAAARNLTTEVEALAGLAQSFQIGGSGAPARAAPPRHAPPRHPAPPRIAEAVRPAEPVRRPPQRKPALALAVAAQDDSWADF